MIDTDEKVDARTVEEDMETRNNMNWLNNRVVELETEVKRLREVEEKNKIIFQSMMTRFRGMWFLLRDVVE